MSDSESPPYKELALLISSLSSLSEGDIRRKRKDDPDFNEFVASLYKFLQIDKIRAKAVRMNTRIPRHIRKADRAPVIKVQLGDGDEHSPEICYMCKHKIMAPSEHPSLCAPCCEVNKYYLEAPLDLSGRFAIVTGGRVKVGYHIALRLLRAGATVAVTSRFPGDTEARYSREADYATWSDRLLIYAVDFRYVKHIDEFVNSIKACTDHVDILVNNAAQTIRRPSAYYEHLIPCETEYALKGASQNGILRPPNTHAQLVPKELPSSVIANITNTGVLDICDRADFPEGQLDIDGQQLDLRPDNTWTRNIGATKIEECVETMVVNSISPFYIIQQLEPLFRLEGAGAGRNYIINITSAEGRFNGLSLPQHPHNNMSKAALNMLTQVLGRDYYQRCNTIVVGIDTGWANVMVGPTAMARLTYWDSAARAIQPLVDKDAHKYIGKQLRNFQLVEW